MLGRLTAALGAAGALVDTIDIIEHQGDVIVGQIQVETRGAAHGEQVVEAAKSSQGWNADRAWNASSSTPSTGPVGAVRGWCTGMTSDQGCTAIATDNTTSSVVARRP